MVERTQGAVPTDDATPWANLSRGALVRRIAEGIAWTHLAGNLLGTQTPIGLAEHIVCYLEECHDGKN
jgi:hypothetical protein